MTTVANDTRAQAEVRAVLDAWMEAARRTDAARILALYEPGVTAFDAIGPLQFKGAEAYGAHWRDCIDQMPGAMVFEPHEVTVEAERDLGVTHFIARCGCEDEKGELETGWIRGTMIMRRGASGWRIMHEHFSNPFDPATMKATCDLTP